MGKINPKDKSKDKLKEYQKQIRKADAMIQVAIQDLNGDSEYTATPPSKEQEQIRRELVVVPVITSASASSATIVTGDSGAVGAAGKVDEMPPAGNLNCEQVKIIAGEAVVPRVTQEKVVAGMSGIAESSMAVSSAIASGSSRDFSFSDFLSDDYYADSSFRQNQSGPSLSACISGMASYTSGYYSALSDCDF